jgi:putative FmdB family regulatory protein
MPIYEYACRSCGRRVEVIHGINDPGPAACDACGGQMAKRVSAPTILFKGSGWAKKDARAASTEKADGGEPKPGEPKPGEPKPGEAAASSGAAKAASGDGGAATKPADSKAPSSPERPSGGEGSGPAPTKSQGRSGGGAG